MELEYKRNIRKLSSGLGFYLFASISVMYFISFTFGIAAALLNGSLESSPILLLDNIASIVSFFVVGLFYCFISKTSVNEILPIKKVKLSTAVMAISIALAVAFTADYLTEIFLNGVSLFGIQNNVEMDYKVSDPIGFALNIIAVAVIPPITEEFAFRGILLQKLRKYGDGFAILVSSLLFGLIHGNIVQIPFAFVVGLAAAFITVKTSSLIPAIITHFLVNFSSVLVSILDENNFADKTVLYGAYELFIVLVIIIGIISSFFLAKEKFFTLKKYTLIPFKERIKAVFSSAGIIFTLILVGIEVVFSVLPNGS